MKTRLKKFQWPKYKFWKLEDPTETKSNSKDQKYILSLNFRESRAIYLNIIKLDLGLLDIMHLYFARDYLHRFVRKNIYKKYFAL